MICMVLYVVSCLVCLALYFDVRYMHLLLYSIFSKLGHAKYCMYWVVLVVRNGT